MAFRFPDQSPAQLWQLPMLLFSFALFGYAAYLFIDPKPGPTVDQQITAARAYLRQERSDAALESLNRILKTQTLTPKKQAAVHLLLATSIEQGQRDLKVNLPANHEQIITQTQLAIRSDGELVADDYRRLAASYEALGKVDDSIKYFRKALAMDSDRELKLHRKVIELLVDAGQADVAEDELKSYLLVSDLTDAERSWGLGRRAQIRIDAGDFTEASLLLGQAARLSLLTDNSNRGELAYRQGYAAWKLGEFASAERFFRLARELMTVSNPLDAEAAYALGKISLADEKFEQAVAFLQDVLTSHPESPVAPLARLERGMARTRLEQDEPALEDFRVVTNEIVQKPTLKRIVSASIETLERAESAMTARANLTGAIEIMSYEQQLHPQPTSAFFLRLAEVLGRRAAQLDALASQVPEHSKSEKPSSGSTDGGVSADQIAKQRQMIRDLLSKSGSAYVIYSRRLTLADDAGYADALWKGIDAFDRAGNTPAAIEALEVFVNERPDDAMAPEALLRLGRTYQAAGLFEKAIDAFKKNQFRYSNSLAASKSAVPLSQAYVAQGPAGYENAERTLLSVVDNNPQLTPDSVEFRQAVLELGQLFYRMGRYEDAVARLEEFANRYPDDPRQSQLRYLMADSYRKSAESMALQIATTDNASADTRPADKLELTVSRRERLRKAKGLFDQVVEMAKTNPPASPLDQTYLKLSHFYRADCLFDLGEYEAAIKLYDTAAFRYQADPSALTAYIQIVNAYIALGKPQEARTANERAKWMHRRIPREAFGDQTYNISWDEWQRWLSFAGDAGLWPKTTDAK